MKRSMLGVIAAGAVASMIGSTALAQDKPAGSMGDDAKACYRHECGKSVKGHDGKCGGTKVDGVDGEKMCKDAGGAWTTAAEAKKFEK